MQRDALPGQGRCPLVPEAPVLRPLRELGPEAKSPKEKQVPTQRWSEVPLSRPCRWALHCCRAGGALLQGSLRTPQPGCPSVRPAWAQGHSRNEAHWTRGEDGGPGGRRLGGAGRGVRSPSAQACARTP